MWSAAARCCGETVGIERIASGPDRSVSSGCLFRLFVPTRHARWLRLCVKAVSAALGVVLGNGVLVGVDRSVGPLSPTPSCALNCSGVPVLYDS